MGTNTFARLMYTEFLKLNRFDLVYTCLFRFLALIASFPNSYVVLWK